MTQPTKFPVGSLVTVKHHTMNSASLGLVVDPAAGHRWATDGQCVEDMMPEGGDKFQLVRILGLRFLEVPTDRSLLPSHEPCRDEIVRWAYIQINQNQQVAGPDVDSIMMFRKNCLLCSYLGMRRATFVHELELLIEYLQLAKEPDGSISRSLLRRNKYFAMLNEILPQK